MFWTMIWKRNRKEGKEEERRSRGSEDLRCSPAPPRSVFFDPEGSGQALLLPALLLLISLLAGEYAFESEAATVEILVDGSDSMRGFFETGSLQSLVENLARNASKGGVILEQSVFVSSPVGAGYKIQTRKRDYRTFVRDFERGQAGFGELTLLDVAFEGRNQKTDILFLVTDNIQSEPESQENTEKFYQKFTRSTCQRIYILPRILSFDGKVFYARNRFESLTAFRTALIRANGVDAFDFSSFVEGSTEYYARYRGKRGLIVYAIQLSDAKEDENAYRQILLAIGKDKVLLIKPIDDQQIEISGVEQLGTASLGNQPNMRLEVSTSPPSLVPFDMVNPPLFRLNQRNLIRFYFRLSSKLKHVNIGKPKKNGKIDVSLSIPNPMVSFHDSDKQLIESGSYHGRVEPPYLVEPLFAMDGERGVRSDHLYVAEIQFGPYSIRWNLENSFALVGKRNISAKMRFDIQMAIPPDQLSLSELFRQRYFTDDPTRIDRIYTPTDLIEFVSKEPIQIYLPVRIGR